jgi:hypothetical protein
MQNDGDIMDVILLYIFIYANEVYITTNELTGVVYRLRQLNHSNIVVEVIGIPFRMCRTISR